MMMQMLLLLCFVVDAFATTDDAPFVVATAPIVATAPVDTVAAIFAALVARVTYVLADVACSYFY